MAKGKSPLLSLGARGTIADALTYQKRGQDTIVREKPIPTDPYSLKQAYQRWLYRDYAHLWTLESEVDKQAYRTRASRYHITGFSLWMREHLRDLSGIVAGWHLDSGTIATARDWGKKGIDATVFGASPATGLIDGALSFDGLNDYLNCTTNPLLDFTSQDFSISMTIYPTSLADNPNLFNKGIVGLNGYVLRFWANGRATFYTSQAGPLQVTEAPAGSFQADEWQRITLTRSGPNVRIYRSQTLVSTTHGVHIDPDSAPAIPALIGIHQNLAIERFQGLIDETVVRDFVIPTELMELRRYP